MLYIITKSEHIALVAQLANNEDDVILTQSAVYLANPKHNQYPLLQSLSCSIYALSVDLKPEGLSRLLRKAFSMISMEEFVDLTVKHDKSISW